MSVNRERIARDVGAIWLLISCMSFIGVIPAGADRQAAMTLSWEHRAGLDEIRRTVAAARPEQWPTGVLYTTARSFVDLSLYRGSEPSTPLSWQTWRQVYFELSRSVQREQRMPTLRQLRAQGTANARRIPLAILDLRYNMLPPPDRLTYPRSRPQDSDRAAVYPEADVFAATMFREQVPQDEPLAIALDPPFYVSNRLGLPQIRVDFDDGVGWRELSFGQAVTVRYAEAGTKQVKVRARDRQGQVRHSIFSLPVLPTATARVAEPLQLDRVWENRTADIPYLDEVAGYDAYVFLGTGNEQLTRPVLIVEGFDFENNRGWEDTINRLQEATLAERLLARGYDLVLVDFADATDYIQRNSFALVHLIESVIAERDGEEPLAIAGVSNGGVIARYALAWMEAQKRAHQTRVFASLDSPHQGANIPLGLQFWIKFFSEYSADVDALLEVLDSPAAQQLLIYHHESRPAPTQNALRATLIEELAQLGNYPRQSRNIAVANGSGAGRLAIQVGDKQVPMEPGELLLDWEVETGVLDINGKVWAVPDQEPETQIFKGKFDLLFFDANRLTVSIQGTQPYDSAPGGWRNSQAAIAAVEPFLGEISTSFPQHAFVPTISALDLRDAAGSPLPLFHDLSRDADLPRKSPFDAFIYAPGLENEPHVELTLDTTTFLIDQLLMQP